MPAAFIGVLNSTPSAGHTWTITLDGPGSATQSFNLPIVGGYTQPQIAGLFADMITASGPAALTAMAEGDQLAIVSRDGSVWTASFAIAPAPAATPAATVADTLGATTVTFTGTLHPREIWSLTVDGNRFDVSIGETYPVGGQPVVADSPQALATIFADWVNGLAGGFHAITQGDALVIVKRAGASGFAAFTTQFRFIPALDNTAEGLYDVDPAGGAVSIELVGAPVIGETWTLDLDGALFSYVVVRDDTLRDVAEALAAQVNAVPATAGFDYVATVEGDRLVIVNTLGTLSADIDVAPANDGANQQLANPSTAPAAWTAILAGAPAVDEIWRVTLDGFNYDHTGGHGRIGRRHRRGAGRSHQLREQPRGPRRCARPGDHRRRHLPGARQAAWI